MVIIHGRIIFNDDGVHVRGGGRVHRVCSLLCACVNHDDDPCESHAILCMFCRILLCFRNYFHFSCSHPTRTLYIHHLNDHDTSAGSHLNKLFRLCPADTSLEHMDANHHLHLFKMKNMFLNY